MDRKTQITKRIKELMKNNKYTAYKLCKFCQIPQSSFSKMIRNHWDWKLEYLIKISKYFSISLDYLVYGKMEDMHKRLYPIYQKFQYEIICLKEELIKLEGMKEKLLMDKAFKKLRKLQVGKNVSVDYKQVNLE
jgi:hypothetical protein